MQTRQINDFIGVSDKQTINYNKDITLTDLEGNQKIIVKCYCTIQANQSISYYMDVIEKDIFNKYKDVIQPEINRYKQDAERIATEHNVPII